MTQSLTHHLWQSTFFALAAGLLTLVFRKNRAHIRYWLWLSASLKFLLPFALLMSIGNELQTKMPAAREIAAPVVSYTLEQFSQPLFIENQQPAPRTNWFPSALAVVWLCGFLAIALTRFRTWLRLRTTLRESRIWAKSKIGLSICPPTLKVRESSGLLEPGVVGLFRPTLLLPQGIENRLTPSELQAVIAHELCHIRRRDNLFAAIHMLVEAIFWFHPLVWWIGARLVTERERACDEEVLSLGNLPDIYADAILNVCKLYTESPLACVSGVSGAGIRQRIEAIMSNRTVIRLNIAQKAALTVAAIAVLAIPVAVGVLTAPATHAQSAPTIRPNFEVASIRPCSREDRPAGGGNGKGGGDRGGATAPANPELFRAVCASVGRLIQTAYVQYADGHASPQGSMNSLKSPQIHGGPGWVNSSDDRYTIEAKPASPQTRAMMSGPMLQALLEDRFKLRIHRESKEVPVYALLLARGGSRLQPTPKGGCTPGEPDSGLPAPVVSGQPLPCGYMDGSESGGVEAVGVPISSFFEILSPQLRRPIVDQTGLTGLFNYHFDVEPGPPNSSPQLDDPAYADTMYTVTNALAKLGLKIQPAKGAVESIVIDHVERPSEN